MSKQYFEPEHKVELKRIFTELADFIHEHGLQQVVTAGPSAAPFSKAIQRAYANRHGGAITIVNLGPYGFELGFNSAHHVDGLLNTLKRRKPGFQMNKKTLLFDEMASSGGSLSTISRRFAEHSMPHKTAVLSNYSNAHFDYVGLRPGKYSGDSLGFKIYLQLSRRMRSYLYNPTSYDPQRFKSFITTLKQELAEIADSVPKAEAKRK